MMINIAHLYYDLMNLYGEHANIRALENHFKNQNIEVKIHYLTKNDLIDFTKYDLYYMGMGTEENQLIVLNDLKKYLLEIKKAIKNKLFIITGNATELFGEYIKVKTKKIEALNIFSYHTLRSPNRIVSELVLTTDVINEKIIGFQNHEGIIKNNLHPWLFTNNEKQGYHQYKFYATHLIGPLLIRNPYLTDYFVKLILKQKKIDYQVNKEGIEYQAYHYFLENNTIKNK